MYIVMGIAKVWEEDDYVNGCIDKWHYAEIDVSFTSADLQGVLDRLQEFTGCDDIHLNSCDEQGRVDLQRYETIEGYKAAGNDYAAWKNGEKKLFHVTYTAYVYKAELSTLIEGNCITITLKTLPQASAQEVFDQITQHLLRQGKAAISNTGACRYRVEVQGEILKCAAGCLIADDEYNRSFESVAWNDLANIGKVPSHHVALVQQLQRVHDRESFEAWPHHFRKIAGDFGLAFHPTP